MNSKAFTRKALTLFLSIALITMLSSIVLATTGKVIGELSLNKINGETPQVLINNELAQSGHTIFSNNTVTTPKNAGATARFGKFGNVEVDTNSVVSFNTENSSLVAKLVSGRIISYSESLTVITANGKTVTPKFGEAVNANSTTVDDNDDYKDCSKDVDNDGDKDCVCIDKDGDGVLECENDGAGWWIWTLVFGGAVVGILAATFSDNNRVALGGGSNVVSPTR